MKHLLQLLAMWLFATSLPALSTDVVPDAQAASCVGKVCTVEGLVVNVFTSRNNNTFLNFGRPYPNQTFNAVIFSESAAQFPNVHTYQGRRARVTGMVKMYKGHPEIILDQPSQLSAAE